MNLKPMHVVARMEILRHVIELEDPPVLFSPAVARQARLETVDLAIFTIRELAKDAE